MLNYEDYIKRSPFLLSGGEKRRIAIAGIISMEPKYLILDEPTAGLDPWGKIEILNELISINKKRNLQRAPKRKLHSAERKKKQFLISLIS